MDDAKCFRETMGKNEKQEGNVPSQAFVRDQMASNRTLLFFNNRLDKGSSGLVGTNDDENTTGNHGLLDRFF